MSKFCRGLFTPFLLSLLFGCNQVTTNTSQLNSPKGNTAVVLGANFTDPVGTLSLVGIVSPRTTTLNVQTTHSDAVVKAFGNKLYVVNKLGADNIEVIDPTNSFAVSLQFSVGQGTNPQQILVTKPDKAYVTLYQPEDNNSPSLTVDDLLVVNPETGTILKTIDLTPFAAEDGDTFARASAMVIIGNRIFVAIQDLPSNLILPPDQPGKIVVIDTDTDSVVGLITLSGKNPVAMNYSSETNKIYIANADYFDLTSSNGGIEVVDPDTLTSLGIFIDDLSLEGTPGDIELDNTKGFVTVSGFDINTGNFATKVVSFDLDPTQPPTLTDIYQGASYIQEIAIDENGLLLVGDRDPNVNGILFIDPDDGTIVDGPINTGPMPSSITFINL